MPPRVKEAKGEGDEGLLLVGEGQRGQGPSGGTQGAELLAASIEGHFYCRFFSLSPHAFSFHPFLH